MSRARRLTDKQRQFVDEYLIDLNATQAAIRAGYSGKRASEMGYQLLQKAPVRDAIAAAKAERSEATKIDSDYVVRRLQQIDQMDVADILDDTGSFRPILEWPQIWRQMISGIDLQELVSGDTESVVRKIKWPDKVKNLELIGKHVDVQAWRERVDSQVTISHEDALDALS